VDKAYVYVVLLRKGEKMAAVAVDEFLGQHDIVLKGLGGFFARPVPGIAGATITGDGRVALVLDPNVLMR
jgi:two-component system chemotaxis sensor kinase CheA